MSEADYVNREAIAAMSTATLRAAIAAGGVAAVVEAMEQELERRSDAATLDAAMRGSYPPNLTD